MSNHLLFQILLSLFSFLFLMCQRVKSLLYHLQYFSPISHPLLLNKLHSPLRLRLMNILILFQSAFQNNELVLAPSLCSQRFDFCLALILLSPYLCQHLTNYIRIFCELRILTKGDDEVYIFLVMWKGRPDVEERPSCLTLIGNPPLFFFSKSKLDWI